MHNYKIALPTLCQYSKYIKNKTLLQEQQLAMTLMSIPCLTNSAGKTCNLNVKFRNEALNMVFKSLNCLVLEWPPLLMNQIMLWGTWLTNLLFTFLEPTARKIVLVAAAQPFGTVYSVTLKSLVHLFNLDAFCIILYSIHGIHGNQVYNLYV